MSSLDVAIDVPKKSSFFSYYFITVDEDFKIHQIKGMSVLETFDYCLDVKKNLVSTFKSIYNIKFNDEEPENRIDASFSSSIADIDSTFIVYCQHAFEQNLNVIGTLIRTYELDKDHKLWIQNGL